MVTGGGSGIGAATVRRLAAEGATVVVADLDDEKAGKLAAEVGGLGLELIRSVDTGSLQLGDT